MQITVAAREYVREKHLRKTPIYSANRFARVMGDLPLEQVTQAAVDEFVQKARNSGQWSAETLRGTVKDLRTLVRFFQQRVIHSDCRRTEPDPEPTPLEHLAAIMDHLAAWSRQWLVLAYWTAARLSDVISLQKQVAEIPAGTVTRVLRWTAAKTRRRHACPVPDWMQAYLSPVQLPFGTCNDWCKVLVRVELERVCRLARLPRILPKNIRQAALTEWAIANGAAGAVVHGNGLRVMDHYVAPLQLLESVMHHVRLPAGWRGEEEHRDEDELVTCFRRLDGDARTLVVQTTRRLVRA